MKLDDFFQLIDMLNLKNEVGCLVLIVCQGVNNVCEILLVLVWVVMQEGKKVVWLFDLMYGNIVKMGNGYKMCEFDKVFNEFEGFMDVFYVEGVYFGGVYFEMIGCDVIECVGGVKIVIEVDLVLCYYMYCDLCLNVDQVFDMFFWIVELFKCVCKNNFVVNVV